MARPFPGLIPTLAGVLAWTVAAAAANAQDPAPPPASPTSASGSFASGFDPIITEPGPQKFLFLMDVSKSMKRFDHAGRQAFFELVYSGVQGYMQQNDSFGLWPFNDHVYAGAYPMQIWVTNDTLHLATRATRFLERQDPTGKSRFEQVLPLLLQVASNVRDVNVFLISDYNLDIEGTPFDDQLNSVYKDRAAELKKTKKPFITLLIARDGKFISGNVTLAGEPIPMPNRPPPPPPPSPKPKAPALAAKPVSTRPPIIMDKSSWPAKPDAAVASADAAATESAVTNTASENLATPTSNPTADGILGPEPSNQRTSATIIATEPASFSTSSPPSSQPATRDESSTLLAQLAPPPTPVSARESSSAKSPSSNGTNAPSLLANLVTPTPARSPLSWPLLWLGTGVLLLGLTATVLYWRASRRSNQTSFITRSLYRK